VAGWLLKKKKKWRPDQTKAAVVARAAHTGGAEADIMAARYGALA
jgi:hypothetical protein